MLKSVFNMNCKLWYIGNTVIVVEHDEDTIMAADYVIDIGWHLPEYLDDYW